MKIIGSQFKGRKILTPVDKKTRPLKDLVKESIFNIIKHSKKFNVNLENSNVLDLFSGVGSFGLEALSRDAKNVAFVENYSASLTILKKNIDNLNLSQKCSIFEKDIINNLNFEILNKQFDIVFLDPPFIEKNISNILLKVYNSNILRKESIFIIHRNNKVKDTLPKEFKILEEKKYGLSKIIFGKF